jgi:hypothetical protein
MLIEQGGIMTWFKLKLTGSFQFVWQVLGGRKMYRMAFVSLVNPDLMIGFTVYVLI